MDFLLKWRKPDSEYKQDIKDEIDVVEAQILDNDKRLNNLSELQNGLLDFVKFGLE